MLIRLHRTAQRWPPHCSQAHPKPTVRVGDARVRRAAPRRAPFRKRRSMRSDFKDPAGQLTSELQNFEDIARYLIPKPGDVPSIPGVDICGGTLSLTGSVGGDLLIYLDFKQRFDLETRIQDNAKKGRVEVVENLKR